MSEIQKTVNGQILWSRFLGNRLVFARQLEPSDLYKYGVDESEYPTRAEKGLVTPILVGYDGTEGVELHRLLEENDSFKKRVKHLEEHHERDIDTKVELLRRDLDESDKRIDQLDKQALRVAPETRPPILMIVFVVPILIIWWLLSLHFVGGI